MNSDALVLVMLMLALGYLSAKLQLLPDNAAEVLNQFVLNICLPAAVLLVVPRLHFDRELLLLVAVPWAMLLASIALVLPLAKWLGLGAEERAVLLLCVPLGNTSFLGYPLTEALLGHEALAYAVIYDQFGSFLILSSFGMWILVRHGGEAKPGLRGILLKLLRFPSFPALLLALTVLPETLPASLTFVLTRLSEALLPIAVFAVGLSLRLRSASSQALPLGFGLLLKLIVLPGLAFFLLSAFTEASTARSVMVLETAMPPMITAAALAISHRLAPALAAALVGYGTLLSLLTLPLWAQLLGAG